MSQTLYLLKSSHDFFLHRTHVQKIILPPPPPLPPKTNNYVYFFLAVIPFFVVFGFVTSLAGRQESRHKGRETDVQYRKIEYRKIK